MTRLFLGLLALSLSSLASASPPTSDAAPPLHPKFRAVHFEALGDLSPKQLSLLIPYLAAHGKRPMQYEEWISQSDGIAAAFLAWTRALTFLQIRLRDGRWITADEMMIAVYVLDGDRIRVELDNELFESWRAAGAPFILTRINGKIERGHFNFDGGDPGGLLHDGSNIQGYTSYYKVPRIQINYTFGNHQADIDLDGYAPWVDGFIPNPHHLTWQNSDVRYWLPEYEKSFGNPGFEVVKNTD